MTRVRLALAAAIIVASATGFAPAADATTYRYWSYWHGEGAHWTYSQTGASGFTPRDGDVEGWRFAVSAGTQGQGAEPRIDPEAAFQQLCAAIKAPTGTKRVAIVFDFGESTDAPPGQVPPPNRGRCVVADMGATGAQIMSKAAEPRTHNGLICAIDGFPSGECAPALTDTRPTPTPSLARPTPSATSASGSSATASATTPTMAGAEPRHSGPRPSGPATSTEPTPSGRASAPGTSASSSPSAVTFADTDAPAGPDTGPGLGAWFGLGLAAIGAGGLGVVLVRRRIADQR